MARSTAAGELMPRLALDIAHAPGERSVATIGDTGFSRIAPGDDAEVRALLRRVVMPGTVQLATTREPTYFAADGLAGSDDLTLLHRCNGMLDGIARLSTLNLHRNGQGERIGYLGELRIAPEARATAGMLRDGYAMLAEHIERSGIDACFTSIASGNARARRVLEHGRKFGLPSYIPLADFVTLVIPTTGRSFSIFSSKDVNVETGADEQELTSFLNRTTRNAQLTLTWSDARWRSLAGHKLSARDFVVLRDGTGNIVAAGAVWDLRHVKQTVVHGYAGALARTRSIVNLLASTGMVPRLPSPGSVLAQGFLFGACVNAPSLWTQLLRQLLAAARARNLEWVCIGRDTNDPELTVLRRITGAREYHTRLYHVHWPDTRQRDWSELPFRPEVALL